jgi:lysophospholipase L1-like esterase
MRALRTVATYVLGWSPFLSSCESSEADGGAARDSLPMTDAGTDGVTTDPTVDLHAIGDRALDTLSSEEAEALCTEDLLRADPCGELGVRTTSSTAECEQVAAECRAGLDESSAASCSRLDLGPPGSCPVTVNQYLACLDAWNTAVSCDQAGYLIWPPEPCAAVVTECDRFSSDFTLDGALPPCTVEESIGKPPDTNDDVYGHDGCRLPVARLVVLGDSIAACAGAGTTPEQCSANLIGNHLRQVASPDLVFETHAVAGARVSDLIGQAHKVSGGSGHVFVWIYAIGNDLATGSADFEGWRAGYNDVFAYFNDTSLFPDGATFLLNAQYGLNDECNPDGSAWSTPEITAFLLEVNRRVFIEVAEARADAVAVDQYPDFLGHGNNANISGCPHCGEDNTAWISDGVHPNALGHAHIAEKWFVALEGMVGPGCADGGVP